MPDLKVKCSACGHQFGMPKHEESKPCPKCGRIVSHLDAIVNPHLVELIMIAAREDIHQIPEVFKTSVRHALQSEQPDIVCGFLEVIPSLLDPHCSGERRRVVVEQCEKLRSDLGTLQ